MCQIRSKRERQQYGQTWHNFIQNTAQPYVVTIYSMVYTIVMFFSPR